MDDDPYFATTVGFKELTGHEPSISGVVGRLRRYSLQQLVMQLSRINIALFVKREATDLARAQSYVLDQLLGSEGRREVLAAVQDARKEDYDPASTILFHEAQVLNAIKLSFLAVSEEAPQTAEPLGHLIEALLMLNDLMNTGVDAADLKPRMAATLLSFIYSLYRYRIVAPLYSTNSPVLRCFS